MSVPGPKCPAKVPDPGGSSLKRLVKLAAVVGLVTLIVTLAAALLPQTGRSARPTVAIGQLPAAAPTAAAKVTHVVVYELLSELGVRNVTYLAEGAAIAQERESATPWSKPLHRTAVEGGNEFYSVSARSAGDGTLRCRIIVNGRVVAENSVSGRQSMITCAR